MIVAGIVVFGAGVALIIGWFSVQSLLQARLLSRWRHSSIDGSGPRKAALYGEVRVRDPLHIGSIGECLWYRETVTEHGNRSSRTLSDVTRMAGFSLMVEGREFRLPYFPTEVYGGRASSRLDGFLASETTRWKWLPLVDHLTVVGQVRKNGFHWEVAKDPYAGLLFTAHHPRRTALKEYVKGGVGLGAAVAIIAATLWIVRVIG